MVENAGRKTLVEKRPFSRSRRRWENNVKMYFEEAGHDIVDWINLAWNRMRSHALVHMLTKLRVP